MNWEHDAIATAKASASFGSDRGQWTVGAGRGAGADEGHLVQQGFAEAVGRAGGAGAGDARFRERLGTRVFRVPPHTLHRFQGGWQPLDFGRVVLAGKQGEPRLAHAARHHDHPATCTHPRSCSHVSGGLTQPRLYVCVGVAGICMSLALTCIM